MCLCITGRGKKAPYNVMTIVVTIITTITYCSDTVEAHSCVDIAKFAYEQYATINQQLQDVSTRGSLSTAYK